MENCDLNDRQIKVAVMKKSTRYKRTQKGSSISSGQKLMNKRINLPKKLKL